MLTHYENFGLQIRRVEKLNAFREDRPHVCLTTLRLATSKVMRSL